MTILLKRNLYSIFTNYHLSKLQHWCNRSLILGIETSCDDTGCAVINNEGKLLAEKCQSQNLIHLRNGGIIPDIAQDLHRTYIKPTVDQTLAEANLKMDDISAVAVTLEPGLPLSLTVGMKYAKHLCRKFNKPLIPIHHMEAHALVARKDNDNIQFPFLTLLISGGHCLLAIAKDVNKFCLLGQSVDFAPGELFDQVARRMKLRNIPEYSKLSGGKAVEEAAKHAENPQQFSFFLPLAEFRNCNFRFNGLKSTVLYHTYKKEKEHSINADQLIPEVYDLCAASLLAVTRHLVHRTQRAIEFCEEIGLIGKDNKQLVVSGGVASNNYIFKALTILCNEYGYGIYRPPQKLCTDNGVMIAWNGLEKWRRNIDIFHDFSKLNIKGASPLGEDLSGEVTKANIKLKLIKLKLNN